MTIQEAINAVLESNCDLWFRPITLRGTGFAYMVNDHAQRFRLGCILLVPTAKGGQVACLEANYILGEWETVSPDVVNTE